MEWGKWLKGLGDGVATALAIPTGGISTAVWGVAKQLTGISGDSELDKQKAIEMLEANPEKKMEFIIKTQELGIREQKIYLEDRQNARSREIAITKATGKKDYNLYILSWVVVLGFYLLVGVMIYKPIIKDSIGPVNQLIGAIAAGFGMVLQYFFGSSKSSQSKNELIAKMDGSKL